MERNSRNNQSSGFKQALIQGGGAGLLLGLSFTGGFFYRGIINQQPNTAEFSLIAEADGLLQQYFLYESPSEEERAHGAVTGLAQTYNDPYTYFVEPQSAEVDSTNLAGRFGGIGAEVYQNEEGKIVISRVYRDNPAYEAGLQANDIIVGVDDTRIDDGNYDLEGVIALIRGDVGEVVNLTVVRNNTEIVFEIIRDEVLIPAVFWNVLEEDPRIGYIHITRFTGRSHDELKQAIEELNADGAEALILDMQDNGGGLLDAGVDIAGEFLEGGVVLYEQRSIGSEEVVNASRGGTALDIPLVVLVNGGTASASEIVAGALADRERAILIGQQTFGKGSVQVIPQLSDGSSLHITTAQWFTPNRQRIEGNGLTPDIEVDTALGPEAIVEAAVDYLHTQIGTPE